MRKFSLQLVGILIIYSALRLMSNQPLAPFVLRDGALLAAVGMLTFAISALNLWRPPPPSVLYYWTTGGRTLFIAGCLTALCGGALYLLPQGGLLGNLVARAETLRMTLQATLWLLGMGMMLVGAIWHGPVRSYRPPTYRWTVDEQGAPLRMADSASGPQSPDNPGAAGTPSNLKLSHAGVMVLALMIILLGAGVRMWQLNTLPAGCIDGECILGARLLEPGAPLVEGNPLSPFGWIARFFFDLAGDTLMGGGLMSLRLAGAVIGILTLPIFFAAATKVSDTGGALLATLLLALNPWHIAAGRSGEPWLLLTLLMAAALWAALRALHGHRRGWWVLAGLATGALTLSAPELRPAIWLWAAATVALGLAYSRDGWSNRLASVSLYSASVIVVSLPTLSLPLALSTVGQSAANVPSAAGLAAAIAPLLQGGANWPTLPVLAAGATALSLGGAAALLRWWPTPATGLILTNLLIFGIAPTLLIAPRTTAGSLILPLLPALFLCAAVALDQLVRTFSAAWARLFRPVLVLAAALTLAALLAGRNLATLTGELNAQATDARNPTLSAMADYLAATVEPSQPDAPLIFAPAALLSLPAARLTAAPALDSGLVQPLGDIVTDMVGDAPPDGSAIARADRPRQLLLPPDDGARRQLVELLLPDVQAEPYLNDEGQLLFTRYTLTADAVTARQGLSGTYFTGQAADNLIADQRDGPLAFDWANLSALTTTESAGAETEVNQEGLSVQWDGSLLIPVAGQYQFSVTGTDAPGTRFTLLLDDRIVLDSSLGVLAQTEDLAQGAYRINMAYSAPTSNPPPLTVNWTPPGGMTTPIPRSALISPAAPEVGLLGAYFDSVDFGNSAINLRKDLIIGSPGAAMGASPGATPVSAVEWRGNLAANRAGEYLLAIVAEGDYQLTLGGQPLIDSRAGAPGSDGLDAYREALIYLEPGWHEITIRFAPAAPTAELQLLWQPPGSEPTLLPPAYLTPHVSALEIDDRPLPPAPLLVNSALGDDAFALSRAAAPRNPQTTVLPANLPALPLTPVWQAGGVCGPGENQLNRPHGVAIDALNQRIYVADTMNRRVAVYDFDGNVSASFGDERLEELTDITLDLAGAPLVLDAGSQQIYHIDPIDGNVTPVTLGTGFYRPRGFDMGPSASLFVADTGGGRVAIVEPGGALVAEYGGPGTALALGQPVDVLATNRALWAVTSEDGRLWNLLTDGSITAIARAISIDGPHLAGLADGSFFLSDPTRGIIFYHRATGQPVQQMSYAGAFETPTGIAAAEIGSEVYLAVADTARCSLSLWRGPRTLLR